MTDPRVQQIREVLESYGDWIVRAGGAPNGTDGMARVQAFVSLDSLVASLQLATNWARVSERDTEDEANPRRSHRSGARRRIIARAAASSEASSGTEET